MSEFSLIWDEDHKPTPEELWELCQEIAKRCSRGDHAVVSISISHEDGSRVTFEHDEGLKKRMEMERNMAM